MSNLKFYITTPIYYVNDKPHIGHAYTTVAADILARWHALQGEDVFFLTGTDEHGAKIAEAAEKAGQEPQVFCNQVSAQFQEVWQKLGIHPDFFIRTTNPEHQKEAVNFLLKLKEKDYFYEKDYSGLYCVGCEKFITEKELVRGKCPDHKSLPARIAETNWFFKLRGFLPQIEKLIQDRELVIQPENARKEVLGLFKQELDDFSISRQKVKWGIPVPWDKTQTIYVWVEALLNYWTALKIVGHEDFWPPDVHLMSHDILKFHAVYWLAMLAAAGVDLPRRIFVHGYFTIDGQKMSKTIGNVIDPNDLVEKFGVDATRYLLLSQFPFGKDGDISEAKMQEMHNADLANGIGNTLSRIIKMVAQFFDGVIPKCKSKSVIEINRIWSDKLKKGLKPDLSDTAVHDFSQSWIGYEKEMENLEFDAALARIVKMTSILDEHIEIWKPFKLVKENKEVAGNKLYCLLESLRQIAWLLLPFMPETADKIFEQLGLDPKKERGKKFAEAIKWGGLESGNKIKPGKSLFPRIQ
ncbi:MAG: methionine--tRNA ligase [Candidatus Doudnabacteria bacterium]